jgi:photosystem II stability/assembly factor-like uncharacterized protein
MGTKQPRFDALEWNNLRFARKGVPAVRRTAVALLAILSAASPASAGWFLQNSGTTADLHGVGMLPGNVNTAWACGQGGTILHTTNGGASWTPQTSGTTNDLHAIAAIEETGAVIAVGDGGTLLLSTDRGATWSSRETSTSLSLHDISDFRFIAVGDSGLILRSTDHGATWPVVASGTTARLSGVSGIFVALAVGDGGVILRSGNQGASWSPVSSGVSTDLRGVPMFSSATVVVGDDGLILRSTNSGTSWFTQESATTARLNEVEFSTAGPGIAYSVGEGGTILKSTSGGQTWIHQQSGVSVELHDVFFYLSDTFGFAVGDGGTILRTGDGGGPLTGVPYPLELASGARLDQNEPNPFGRATTIRFHLAAEGFATLRVFDAAGRQRATVFAGALPAGPHEMEWDARGLESGTYFYRLEAHGGVDSRRAVVAR